MSSTDIIALAGFMLGLPSAMVAIGDLRKQRMTPQAATPVKAPIETRPIGGPLSRPRRFLSMVIDTYAVGLVAAILSAVLTPLDATIEEADTIFAVMLIITAVGLAGWNSATGRSPGKLLVGGRVVRHSDNTPIRFLQSLLRIACQLIPFGFWLVLGEQRRTAADHLTGTSVVSTRQ